MENEKTYLSLRINKEDYEKFKDLQIGLMVHLKQKVNLHQTFEHVVRRAHKEYKRKR